MTASGTGEDILAPLFSLPGAPEVWVYNLSFDGEFVYYELLRRGFRLLYGCEKSENPLDACFDLIEDLSGIIRLTIWECGRKIILRDEYRLFRRKLADLPALCGFSAVEVKGSIDYEAPRPRDYVKSAAEDNYNRSDCTIALRAMQWLRRFAAKGNTIGAVALESWKEACGGRSPFKPLTNEERGAMRSIYSAGIVICPPGGLTVQGVRGRVYDRNSMYPAEAVGKLPVAVRSWDRVPSACGAPDREGVAFHVLMEGVRLKPGGFGLIITPFTGSAREYIPALDKWFYNYELQAIFEEYTVEKFHVVETVIFEMEDIATDWMRAHYAEKKKGGAGREFHKLILNNLTGKWGQNSIAEMVRRVGSDEGYKCYRVNEQSEGGLNWRFMPAVAMVTSRSRLVLRDAAKKMDRLYYTDTDSVHGEGELPTEMIGDDLGQWKCEAEFSEAKYIKPKSYAERGDNSAVLRHAGINNDARLAVLGKDGREVPGDLINYDNMNPGARFFTKQAVRKKGGIAIEWKIKTL